MQLETVGEIVRVLRSRLGIEQVELARKFGWRDASVVSRIERDRIRPKRRTLLKLAENLANPSVTGTPAEVRAWLFLAAGILPTAREIDELGDRIAHIENLPHPAGVMDFGWYLWRANEWLREGVGLPESYIGRNYLEMFFEEGGSVREHLGNLWIILAPLVIADFRSDTARRRDQRWFKTLLTALGTLPDFEHLWSNTAQSYQNVFGWSHTSLGRGMISVVRSHLTADPRLIVGQLVPEDRASRNLMVKYRALPRTSRVALPGTHS